MNTSQLLQSLCPVLQTYDIYIYIYMYKRLQLAVKNVGR